LKLIDFNKNTNKVFLNHSDNLEKRILLNFSHGMEVKTLLYIILIILYNVAFAQNDDEPIKPIVGGSSVNISDYPYQVSLQTKIGASYYHFCGGSIINEYWILSAAHCVPTTQPEDLYIRVGFTDLNSNDGQIYTVAEIISHPSYNDNTYDNDIVLIKLNSPINFGSLTADSILLANSANESAGLFDEGTQAKVTGWGHTSFGGSGSNSLLMGQVEIFNNSTVQGWGTYVGALTNNMICAGIQSGGVDACQGDSGGPLVVSDNGNYVQVGIVSWGDGCAEANKPGVYTKVSNYINWINNYVYPSVEETDVTGLPNNGDGNGDGVIDNLQSSVQTILDYSSNYYVTIQSTDGYSINELVASEYLGDDNYTFPFGQFEFKINASQATIKIYFHATSDLSNYTYRKLFADGNYRQFENVTFSTETIGGNQVAVATLTLTDGGPGDYDGIVNGVIYDPGGPSLPVSANIPFWDWWYLFILFPFIVLLYKKTNQVS
jgi:trypsin